MKQIISYILFSLLGVSAFAQSDSISVAQYRQKVLDYSIQVKQSDEQINAIKNIMLEAKTSFLPRLDFAGSAQYRVNDYDIELGGPSVEMPGETYSLNADLTQIVYGGGVVKHGYKITQLQHEVAQNSKKLTVTNMAHSANLLYWTVGAKHALSILTKRYVEIISELEDIVRARFNDGLISKTDLLQIQANLSDAKIQHNEARKSYILSMQSLNLFMGYDPLAKIDLTEHINKTTPLPSVMMSLDEALARRTEYKVSKLAVNIQESQFKVEQSKFLPQLAVGAKESWGTQALNFDGSTMFNTYVYASLKVPIFKWGAKHKNAATQRALIRGSEYDTQLVKDEISKELYSSYTELTESRKQVEFAEEATSISVQSLELNTFSYNEGRLPIIDVLSAQVAWVQSSSALIRAWYQEKIAYSDYNKAIGNISY